MDFVHDSFDSARKFRMLIIIDDFNGECLRIEVDTSLSGHQVAKILDQPTETRGLPRIYCCGQWHRVHKQSHD
jgi:putative transposase